LRPDGGGVLLRVQDAGIGLPPGSAETIFTPFGRAENALARQLPGLGLGLYVCREIIAQHGGRIWAESPGEDQGTTLSLWLPAQR
jgi:signal transduction histidine kinase